MSSVEDVVREKTKVKKAKKKFKRDKSELSKDAVVCLTEVNYLL